MRNASPRAVGGEWDSRLSHRKSPRGIAPLHFLSTAHFVNITSRSRAKRKSRQSPGKPARRGICRAHALHSANPSAPRSSPCIVVDNNRLVCARSSGRKQTHRLLIARLAERSTSESRLCLPNTVSHREITRTLSTVDIVIASKLFSQPDPQIL